MSTIEQLEQLVAKCDSMLEHLRRERLRRDQYLKPKAPAEEVKAVRQESQPFLLALKTDNSRASEDI
jgi:hypothetical protein